MWGVPMLVNPFSFGGTVGRAQYVVTMASCLFTVVVGLVAILSAGGIAIFERHPDTGISNGFSAEAARWFAAAAAVAFWIVAALLVRRLRDFYTPSLSWLLVVRWTFFVGMPLLAFLQIFTPVYERTYYDGSLNAMLLALLAYAAFPRSSLDPDTPAMTPVSRQPASDRAIGGEVRRGSGRVFGKR